MKYDFETLVDRSTHGSGKWDDMKRKSPSSHTVRCPCPLRTWSLRTPPR